MIGINTLIGSQADTSTLQQWVEKSGGKFDVILDDGGHKNHEIITTFNILYDKALLPGGYCFIEDLQVRRCVCFIYLFINDITIINYYIKYNNILYYTIYTYYAHTIHLYTHTIHLFYFIYTLIHIHCAYICHIYHIMHLYTHTVLTPYSYYT